MNTRLISATVEKILKDLYRASDNYRLEELTTIISKNMIATDTTEKWFGYRNEYYSITSKLPRGLPVLLHRSLRSRMKEYLAYCDKLDAEKQIVRSYIIQVAQKVRYREHILEFLPNNTHHLLKGLVGLFPTVDSMEATPLGEEEKAAFRATNEKYLEVMRSRMVINLLGA